MGIMDSFVQNAFLTQTVRKWTKLELKHISETHKCDVSLSYHLFQQKNRESEEDININDEGLDNMKHQY